MQNNNFKVGDEVGTQDKDSKEKVDLYANCPANGKLKLVHSFESARFVPIGNTPVRLAPVVDGKLFGKNEVGQAITTDHRPERDSGSRKVSRRISSTKSRFSRTPLPRKSTRLFNSYQGVIGDLSGWLQTQWTHRLSTALAGA